MVSYLENNIAIFRLVSIAIIKTWFNVGHRDLNMTKVENKKHSGEGNNYLSSGFWHE